MFSFSTVSLLFAFIFLAYWTFRRMMKKAENEWTKNGIPMAKQENILKIFFVKDFTLSKAEMQRYEQLKEYKFGGSMELFSPLLYVMDLDLARTIYTKDFDNFVDRRHFNLESDPHMHLGLFNQKGENWKSVRSRTSPSFTTGKIRRMYPIFESSSLKLVEAVRGQLERQGNGIIAIRPYLQKLTMDVIASAAFGIQSDVFENPNSTFAKMGKIIQNQFSGLSLFKLIISVIFPELSNKLGLKFLDVEADKFFSHLIKKSLEHRDRTGEKREDFLQLMIEARDDPTYQNKEGSDDMKEGNQLEFSEDLIIAQCIGFFFGGSDTIEAFLSWAVYELALNQDIQEKLYEGLENLREENGGKLSYDSAISMEYLDKVVSETLRKYPPVSRNERKTMAPYKVPGTDFILPKGTFVGLPIYPVHHDPKYWPNPDRFDPERFTKENIANRHPYAYAPFGQGPRMCIANRFAIIEGKSVLAQLVLNFKFETCEKSVYPPKFSNNVTLKPADDMWVNIIPRQY